MAIRLKPMKRVLKKTGSIYLHCDPTASHYLKMIMDAIFLVKNFRNEIIWCYAGGGVPKRDYPRKHDVIFRYAGTNRTFNIERRSYGSHAKSGRRATDLGGTRKVDYNPDGTPINCWWADISPLINWHSERLGYPTQKPLDLLRRIINASSNENDLVFDPFCGCGTTLHAAEELKRNWIGVDISQFSTGLIRNRILDHFPLLHRGNIPIIGCPLSVVDAEDLAKADRFEFEKWACGEVGAEGLFHEPGERGADGGVDGIIPFYTSQELFNKSPPEKTFAVVQVKSGKVHPDSVRALSTTVRQSGAKCGVLICFDKYMTTVENNREKKRLKDITGDFNFIQGLSVENLIKGEKPILPPIPMAA